MTDIEAAQRAVEWVLGTPAPRAAEDAGPDAKGCVVIDLSPSDVLALALDFGVSHPEAEHGQPVPEVDTDAA